MMKVIKKTIKWYFNRINESTLLTPSCMIPISK
jgi:hypothetical protein